MSFSQNKIIATLDKGWVGALLGILLPMLILPISYFFVNHDFGFQEYMRYTTSRAMMGSMIRMCVFGNLIIFFIGNYFKMFYFCRGLFFPSIVYILAMMYLKYGI